MNSLIKKIIISETIERYNTLLQKHSDITPAILNQLLSIDPTTKMENGEVKYVGPYSNWILRQYKSDGTILQDAVRIRKALGMFERNKIRMPQKDINQIKSVSELVQMVAAANVDGDFSTTKSERKERVMAEKVKKIHETKTWLLLSPQTKEASIAIAGPPLTQWCTSSIGDDTSPNLFDTYNNLNNLIILCNKTILNPPGKNEGKPKPLLQFHVFETFDKKYNMKCIGYELQDTKKNNFSLMELLKMYPELQLWFSEYFESCTDKFLQTDAEFDHFYDKFFNPIFNQLRFDG